MAKWYERTLFLLIIGFITILISVSVVGAAQDCSDPDNPNTCFKTNSGYTFQTIDAAYAEWIKSGNNPILFPPCFDTNKVQVPGVKTFPHELSEGWTEVVNGVPIKYPAYLWCYNVKAPLIKNGPSMSTLDAQVGLPYFWPTPTPLIKMDTSGQVFSYNPINGCAGGTSGFSVGELENCGIKWTYKLAPNGQFQRFSYITKKLERVGASPLIMAPKIGSSFEPGIILGADAPSTYDYREVGGAASTCQVINGLPIFSKKISGCTKEVYVCHHTNPNCTNGNSLQNGGLSTVPPPDDYNSWPDSNMCYLLPMAEGKIKMRIYRKDTGFEITPGQGKFLRDLGFVGGRNDCREGYFTTGGGCCFNSIAEGQPGSLCYHTNPPCNLPNAPTGLTAAQITTPTMGIKLTWSHVSTTEDGYQIYRGTSSTDITTLLNTTSLVPKGTRTYTDTTGTATTRYYYTVKAVLSGDKKGNTSLSANNLFP